MAYSFNDPYRILRWVLRLNGIVVGLGLGLLLLTYPGQLLTIWGLNPEDPAWPARLGGASLIGMGINYWSMAETATMRSQAVIGVILANAVLAGVLFVSYLQGDLTNVTRLGQLLLFVIFALCLACVVLPISFLREEMME